jgi:hypothetical protein
MRFSGLGFSAVCFLVVACGATAGEADEVGTVGDVGSTSVALRGSAGSFRGETPSNPGLRVDWVEVGGAQRADGLVLSATLRNESDQDFRIRAALTGPDQRGQTVAPRTAIEFLAAGASTRVEFSVAQLPVRSSRSGTEVGVGVDYVDSRGTTRRVFSPPRYLRFSENFRRVRVSAKQRVIKPTRRGGIAGIWKRAKTRTQGEFAAKHFDSITGRVEDAQLTFVVPYSSRDESPWFNAPPLNGGGGDYEHPYRACGHWRAEYLDSNGGEDYLSKAFIADYPARFARASLTAGGEGDPVTEIWSGQLDAEGCTPSFPLDPLGDYGLYMEPILERPDGTELEIRYDSVSTESYMTYFSPGFPSILPVTSVKVKPNVHTYITQVAAILSQALFTEDMGLDDDYVEVWADKVCNSSTTACYKNSRLYIGMRDNGIHNSSYKYVVAHEFGHAVQARAGAGVNGEGYLSHYDDEVDVEECRCDHVESANQYHCLQSREGLGDAITEGWGQFYGSKVFNKPYQDDCVFAYYKEFLNDGDVELVPNWHSCVEPATWMESKCEGQRRGTEFDWMQFLYFVNTQSDFPATIADFAAIFSGAGSQPIDDEPVSSGIHWSAIHEAAEDHFGPQTPEFLAFEGAANLYGVAH